MALFKKKQLDEPDYVTRKREEVRKGLERVFGEANIDEDGDFYFVHDASLSFGNVTDFGDGDTVWNVFSPILRGVRLSPELFHFAATRTLVLGSFVVEEHDDGKTGILQVTCSILANDLDDSELTHSVMAVAQVTAGMGSELQSRFGGKLASDD